MIIIPFHFNYIFQKQQLKEMHAAVYVLTILPDHIKKMIKWYLLSFGTKLCQIVRPLIPTLPSCYN